MIAATSVDLEERVRDGRFRSDLFYRLNLARIHLPPLRERCADIPVLLELFLSRLGSKLTFKADALAFLQGLPWPGNVRELENFVESAAIQFARGPVDAALADRIFRVQRGEVVSCRPLDEARPIVCRHNRSIDRPALVKVLAQTGGNQSAAARELGVSRHVIARALRRGA